MLTSIGVTIIVIIAVLIFWPKAEVGEDLFGFKGIALYVDTDKEAKVFVNHKYKIVAKPDFIFKTSGVLPKYILVERKSGFREPADYDISQVMASVIAARTVYPKINHAILSTKKGNYPIDVNCSNAKLFKMIKRQHNLVQDAYQGKVINETCASPEKCRTCATRYNCQLKYRG